jgi:hypothetical protein
MTVDVPPVMVSMPLERACEPGLLCTVERETERSGWPHQSTAAERVEITSRVMRLRLRGPGTVLCRFGPTVSRAVCGVRPKGKPGRRVNVKVWEDGSMASWYNGEPYAR